jgi:predicted kinase
VPDPPFSAEKQEPGTPSGMPGTRPLLVVVTGPPASGKSGLAEDLAEALRLPLLTKDGVKETLFDTLGTGDHDWSKRLGEATWRVIFHVIEGQLDAGSSLVVEGNFEPGFANPLFAELPPFRALQVHCTASDEELLERFSERAQEGRRHPGHAEGESAEADLAAGLREGRWTRLDLPGPLVEYSRPNDKGERRRLKSEVVARVQALVQG